MTDETDGVAKVAELLKEDRFALLTTIAEDGMLTSRPMALQEVEFDGDLWFFAKGDSRKVAHLTANPQVNVTTSTGDSWVSLTGRARVVTDDAKKKDLWNPGVEAWFPDGPEDPSIVLIKVEGDGAEYWDSPGGKIATVLSLVKAKATGTPYSGGDNAKVDL